MHDNANNDNIIRFHSLGVFSLSVSVKKARFVCEEGSYPWLKRVERGGRGRSILKKHLHERKFANCTVQISKWFKRRMSPHVLILSQSFLNHISFNQFILWLENEKKSNQERVAGEEEVSIFFFSKKLK